MANRTLMRCATGATLAAALSLVVVTTSSADPRSDAAAPYYNSYGSGGYGVGYYDYDPDAIVVTPGPGYYDAASFYAWPRPGLCRFSIRGC
jgi:hypothetical protein